MKTVLDVGSSFIITSYTKPKSDGSGGIIYTDKENNIAEHVGFVNDVTTYVRVDEKNNLFIPYSIMPHVIKKLYAEIIKIETKEVPPEEVDY